MTTRVLALVWVLSLTFLPLAASAHTLDVPPSVEADAAGDFSFEAVFTVGPGPAELAAYSWFGIENVERGIVADCFCGPDCLLEEGETIVIFVNEQLTDPTLPGVVLVDVALCTEPGLSTEVPISPFSSPPVPTLSAWGMALMAIVLLATSLLLASRRRARAGVD